MNRREILGAGPWFGKDLDPLMADLRSVLTSGQLVQGPFGAEFEAQCAAMAGTPYAAAVNSGGTALELALLALDVRGKEVIVPTQTFIASANAVTRAGGVPVFADVERDTMCLDPDEVIRRTTPRTAGVLAVHMFGLMAPSLRRIEQWCKDRGLFLLEDAAHAHGASLDGRLAGSLGDAGCFSFFATKVVTTGEGGVVTTARTDIHQAVVSLRNHGRADGRADFDRAGNNFRLTELQAAIGCHQMRLLDEIGSHRRRVAAVYQQRLAASPALSLLPQFHEATHAYWRFPAYLADGLDRGQLQRAMWERHGVRVTWMYEPLCHQQPVSLTQGPQPCLPVAEWAIDRLINLPTHMDVTEADAAVVADALLEELAVLAP